MPDLQLRLRVAISAHLRSAILSQKRFGTTISGRIELAGCRLRSAAREEKRCGMEPAAAQNVNLPPETVACGIASPRIASALGPRSCRAVAGLVPRGRLLVSDQHGGTRGRAAALGDDLAGHPAARSYRLPRTRRRRSTRPKWTTARTRDSPLRGRRCAAGPHRVERRALAQTKACRSARRRRNTTTTRPSSKTPAAECPPT